MHPCIPGDLRKSCKKVIRNEKSGWSIYIRFEDEKVESDKSYQCLLVPDPKTLPTTAQKEEVDPPAPVPVRQLRDHYAYAFSEFIALSSATLKVYKATCEGILGLYLNKYTADGCA
ncbi:hypothetical protein EVAR_34590_1 [Eumeta japonica]|uniref:Uncharacterized protein n=1 Tax=Eumeta variegata TaxID=151549 RepID=A0A4C1VIK8_EUMVA|nr:hypothetical protein EVAR_34590_1 [Eumeta japonica]